MSRVNSSGRSRRHGPGLSLVIPIYNEKGSLPSLIAEIDPVMGELGHVFEVILVDDGCTDGSSELLTELAARHQSIRILRFAHNRGQSAALAAGFAAARGSIVVTMDADLQNDPRDIPRVLAALEDCDLVSGIRRGRQDSLSRRIASRVANAIRSWLLGDSISDVGCSLKAYRRSFLTSLAVFDGMHRFLPALVKAQGGRIREIEVNHRARRYDQSKYTIGGRFLRGVRDLLGVHWLLARSVRTDYQEFESSHDLD